MHGGASTGPRTPEGLARSKRSRFKHGAYSAEFKAELRYVRDLVREGRALLSRILEHSRCGGEPTKEGIKIN